MTRSQVSLLYSGAKGTLATAMLAMVVNLTVPAPPAQAGILGGAIGGGLSVASSAAAVAPAPAPWSAVAPGLFGSEIDEQQMFLSPTRH